MNSARYTWGVDGYGRAHIALESDLVVIFSMLPGVSGSIGVWLLENQELTQ